MSLAFLEFELTSIVPLLGIGLVLASVMMSLRKKQRQAGSRVSAREQLERGRQERAMRGDLDQLMVEIEQLTRRFGAQLDAKTIQLEKLLDEADRRIARLEQLQGSDRAGNQARGLTEPNSASMNGGSSEVTEPEDPLSRSVCELADEGLAPLDIARRLDEHVGKVELILALRQV